MRAPIAPISLAEFQAARARIAGTAVRTPLVRLYVDSPCEIFLKLETLQPIGSFKLRGALNAMRALPPARLADGVYTASAGTWPRGSRGPRVSWASHAAWSRGPMRRKRRSTRSNASARRSG